VGDFGLKCENCDHENDDDAKFCEKCGSEIKSYVPKQKEGMKNSIKLLVVIVVILVAVLALVSGMLLQLNKNPSISNQSANVENQNPSPVTSQVSQPSWHEIKTVTNPTDGLVSFNIQGQQCKVVISAIPTVNYNMNILGVDLLKNNMAVDTAYISWSATESPSPKEDTVISSAGPGNYQVNIAVTNLQTWNIKIYDYY
jgi:hypothetical protein